MPRITRPNLEPAAATTQRNPGGRRKIFRWLPTLLLTACAAAPQTNILQREQWQAATTDSEVTALPPLRLAVKQLLAIPRGVVVITHPADAAGTQWAGQVQRRLIALGVASTQIQLQPHATDDFIHLQVITEPTP